MKKCNHKVGILTLGILIAPCVIGMEPGNFHFQPQKRTPHRGKNTLHDVPAKKESSLKNPKKSSRPAQEGLKALLAQEPYENQETVSIQEPCENQKIDNLARHKKQWDKMLGAVCGEISHSQKKISQQALPQRAACYMTCALNTYFSKVFDTATDTQEKALLSSYITTLHELIAIQKRLNTTLYDTEKITKTTTAVAYLKSVGRYFAHRLRKVNNPAKKTILSGCIVEIRTAINKRQFPHQPVILEPTKIQAKPIKKALKIFITTIQKRAEDTLLEAKETNAVKPLQQLVTSLAELTCNANTTDDEQEVLHHFINQLNDATRDLQLYLKQQTETPPPTVCSNDTVHFYTRKDRAQSPKKTEPEINIPAEQAVASATPTPEKSASAQTSKAIMTEEQFHTILDAVHIEYQLSKSFNYLDDVLNTFAKHNASRSPEALTLTYLKDNPHFLLCDTTTPNQAT